MGEGREGERQRGLWEGGGGGGRCEEIRVSGRDGSRPKDAEGEKRR